MKSSLRIIVTGLIGQHHTLGGVAWDYLQYVMGLRELGHDVWYFEDSGEWPYNLDGGPDGNDWVAYDCSENVEYLRHIFSFAQLADRWAYRFPIRSEWHGIPDSKRKEVIKTADLLINVSGTLENPSHYSDIKKRVYIDSDPVFTQIKLKSGQEDFCQRVHSHTTHFSFGEKLPDYLQTDGIHWHPTRSPIVLPCWREQSTIGKRYTTVMNWTSYPPLSFEGRKYGQKDTEFARFLDLPRMSKGPQFEVAMSKLVHGNWQTNIRDQAPGGTFASPTEMLEHFGWKVVDAQAECGNLFDYRNYIETSRAEWSIAKGGYAGVGPGWFSCRSACYLAAGKPVIVQDTGFDGIIPTGTGVFSFNTIPEAVDALERVESDYKAASIAAREIADEYFGASKVLSKLIDTTYAGVPPAVLSNR